jgi:hypothetical protein
LGRRNRHAENGEADGQENFDFFHGFFSDGKLA